MKKTINNNSLRDITITLNLFIITLGINAQSYTISGKIKSESNNLIEYATIRLVNNDSIFIDGGVSDNKGLFTVEFIKKDNFHLIISCVGFQSKLIALNNIENSTDIGIIVLDSISTQLDEVVVRGSSQIRKEDKILIFPTKLQQKHAANGFELLNNLMIPQIDIDKLNKAVTIRGKRVLLAINGRPVKNKEEILMLRPQDILRVEYHDQPTGFYAGNEAVIDYITKQYEFGGYMGVSGTQNLTYTGGNYLATARINNKGSEYSIGYSYDYLTDKNIRNEIDELFIYPDSDLKRSEIGAPSIEKNKAHQVFINYYQANNDDRFNVQLGYNDKKSPGNILQSLQLYSGKYNFTRNLVDNNTEKSKQPYISLYTYQQFKNKQSIYIHFNLNYSENYFHRFYKETSKDSNVNTISSTVNENYLNTMTNMNYTKSFTKERELTVQFANFYRNTKSKYEGANANNEKLLTSESLGFLHLSRKWSKLFLSMRLGGSHLYYKQNEIESKNYYSFRPSVIAKYDLNSKNSIQYRGSWDNSFPTLSLMSDVVQSIDFLQKRKGNPDLKIMKLLNNSLTYSYLSDFFNANINIEYFNFSPTTKNTVYYDGSQFVHSYESNGSYHLITPGIGLTLKLFEDHVNFKVNSGLNRYIITGIPNNQHTNWYINPSVQYFYKDFSANAFYYSPQKGVSSSLNLWENSERYGLYASYNKKGISLTIGTQNPFSTYRRTYQKAFDVYSSQTIKYNSQNDHLLYLRFSYNFSFGRNYKYSKIHSNSPSNSAIVKGLKE